MLGLISTKLPCANEVKVLWKSGADCPYLCFLTARFGLSRVTLGISILRVGSGAVFERRNRLLESCPSQASGGVHV